MSWLPRISMGPTLAQLSARLRCAECGGQLHSVKPWRMEDVIGKPLGQRGKFYPRRSNAHAPMARDASKIVNAKNR